ncbi:ubiquitin-like-specific protease 1D [Solanum tuberosum]|uniref:ubiquitin-like-specific protease 1D n=1 Tax=Solanum tuberosum TaxID=4113 RepID=UPI00073A443E|nr:PREDICTED: ubiquitin-like-specific protease 1D [Solanum tuberosum]XP_015158618.1 PREDICTED: ubiquitin-like-specific protease 1D [Solanum tuberosum]XP_015158620.1 PREDICTED: ubiquitin-like-specific protease 1D [Solanum tuberosum]
MPKRSRNVVEPRHSSRLRELENRRNDRSEGECLRELSNRRNDRSEGECLRELSNRRNDRSEGECLRELSNRRNDRSEGERTQVASTLDSAVEPHRSSRLCELSNRRNDRSEGESLCGLSNRRKDRSEGERTGNDISNGECMGNDRSKGERTGNDISEGERMGNDRSEGERTGNGRSEGERTGNDRSEGERLRELSNSRNSRSRNERSEGEHTGNDISEGEHAGNDISEGEHMGNDQSEGERTGNDRSEGERLRELSNSRNSRSEGKRLRGLPKRRNSRSEGERLRRNSRSEGKLNSINFDCYLENIWRKLPEDKKNLFACLDSMWFSSYRNKQYESKVLRWIKNKDIFSKKYVFVPIVLWGHWCLLIFCHLGESLESESTTPCMLLLDSLQIADSSRFAPEIRKFVSSIFNNEERPESKRLIKKIPLLVPQVPQQRNATDCGIFVLYYISRFLENAPETFSISEGYPYFMKEDWFTHDQLESFWQDLQTVNKNSSSADGNSSDSDDVICLD